MLYASLALCLLSGCALAPNTLRPELEHLSHATQHEPLASHPTEYYANLANLVLHWEIGHTEVEIAEGIDLDRRYPQGFGEIEGPREQFSARVGYSFRLK